CTPDEKEGTPSGETAQAGPGPGEQVFQGVCRGNCSSSCVMNVVVRDGKIVKTEPLEMDNPDDSRMCVRGHTHPQRVYAPNRLKHPLRRVEGTPRGAGEWEQLSWDEAISYIAKKWKGFREEFGDSSIAYHYGSGNLAFDPKFTLRLFRAMHSTNIVQTVDYAYCYYMGPKVLGYGPWFFGNDPKTMTSAKNVFVWGMNPSHSWATSWPYVQNAIDAGAKFVVIDPQFTVMAGKADQYVQIRPGTDAALAMAMFNILLDEGFNDDDYLRKGTVAPFLVKDEDGRYLRMSDLGVEPTEGPVDPRTGQPTVVDPFVMRAEDGTLGTIEEIAEPVIRGTFEIEGHTVTTAFDLLVERCSEWTPEKASGVTQVPVDTIYDLARTFADGPTTVMLNMGIDHLSNGGAAYHAMFCLSFVTGQVGFPGAGWTGASFNMSSGVVNSYATYPEGGTPGPEVFNQYLPMVMETGMFNGNPLPIKSLYCIILNPLVTSTGRTEQLEAFDKIEFIVVADVILSETAKYADVVLPVPHYFEKWDLSYNVTPVVAVSEKAIEPLYDCKTDHEITCLLAEAMGVADTVNMTWDEYMDHCLDADGARAFGVNSWEDMKEMKIFYSARDGWCHGQDYTFMTPTGRAQFYLEDAKPLNDYGQVASGEFDPRKEALPYWDPPVEAWHENSLHGQYPLQIMTWRSRFKVHSQFTHIPWLLELWPEPYLYMNAEDAAAREISTGDTIKAFNDRGHMVCKAVCSAGIAPGTVLQDHGWEIDQYIDGSLSDLIGNNSHPATNHMAWYDSLCQVEKA
ncbi:MAG: molybdopterin-dependent oxidoreductase, partial [Coriobacteriaceae bacterium]|nr:molybdopterin-dependent oxidoreductase [Coriobacteriaceae bacterium]